MNLIYHINSIFYTLMMFIDDTTNNVVKNSELIMPPTAPALPEEVAWSMIYAEAGLVGVLLSIAVVALWKIGSKIFKEVREQNNKVFEEARLQNKQLLETHAAALNKVSESIMRVENAVKLSDVNNQHALGRVTDNLNAAVTKLDKHEIKIEALTTRTHEHSSRIKVLEKK